MIRSRLSNPQVQIWSILLVFVVLGVVYSLVTPPLEASDEFDHYPYVQHVQTELSLPVMDPQDPEPWRQEAGQPPLYYALMAGVTFWIDTSDVLDVRQLNKHAFIGDPGQTCNKNLVIHRPERETFPWTGTVLAVHLIRLVSVGLGAVTVWLVWQVAAHLCPTLLWVPPLAAALTAFNPMFLFISAAVNNDVLSALLGSLTLLLLLKRRESEDLLRIDLWLGDVLGLAALTKVSLVAMIPLAMTVVAFDTWRRHPDESKVRRATEVLKHCAVIGLLAAAISVWWYIRNWRLYGNLTGLNVFMEILGQRAEPLTWRGLWGEFGTFRWTYWGLFGGVNVAAPKGLYVLGDLLALAGLAGLIRRAWRRRREEAGLWWIPATWVGLLFVLLLRWVLLYYSFQGRLMFPAVAALSTFLALGLGEWLPSRWRPAAGWAVGGTLLILAAIIPFASIRPAYAYPDPLTLADLSEDVRVEPVDVGGVAQVVGWEMAPQTVSPGDRSAYVDIVVYWEAAAPDGQDYISFANLLGRDHQPVGQINRHPGCGMVPTSRWEPGQVWRDPYRIPVAPDASAPSVLWAVVGLYDPGPNETLGTVVVGGAKLSPPEATPQDHPLAVDLEEGISLRGYGLEPETVSAGETITLTLRWEAHTSPGADYQVFVHLIGTDPDPVAQGDGPPLAGFYPTGAWAPGEVIADPHPIPLPEDVPAGQYRIVVGLYDLDTLVRLARLDGAGNAVEIPTPVTVR